MTNPESRIVVFDLGGVLVDLNQPAERMDLGLDHDTFWSLWSTLPIVRAWETGAMPNDKFFHELAQQFDVNDGREMEQRFRRWRLPLFDGINAVLESVTENRRVGLLSNINPVHWEQQSADTKVFDQFEHLFLSFQTGRYKPDVDAYRQLSETFQCQPADIVFFDDVIGNVDAARQCGLNAAQVRGIDELRQALREHASITC
ncbi:MAG: HAD-IA family hydrolase [Pseudomonadota bacterium]